MSRAFTSAATIVGAVLLTAMCGACTKPVQPPTEQKPEPQAHAELREAIQKPIAKAKAVDGAVQDAAGQQRAAIDAAAGG